MLTSLSLARLLFPQSGVSFSAIQQDSQAPPESDNDSEDPDEANNRKLRMFDGMSLMDVQQLLHPDYVKLRDTQLFDPNAMPVVNPDDIQNHLTLSMARTVIGSSERRR